MTRLALVEQDGAGGMIHYAYQLADCLTGAGADVTLHTAGPATSSRWTPHRFTVRDEMNLWPAIESPPLRGLGTIGRRSGVPGVRRVTPWCGTAFSGRLIGERPDVVLFSTIRFPFQVVFLRRLRRHGLVLAQVCHEFELRCGAAGRERSASGCRWPSTGPSRWYSSMEEQNRKAFLAPLSDRCRPHPGDPSRQRIDVPAPGGCGRGLEGAVRARR